MYILYSVGTNVLRYYYPIADEPSTPPLLDTNKMKYSAGDLINVSCITQESYPAVNISWFLNNQTVFFYINNFIYDAES